MRHSEAYQGEVRWGVLGVAAIAIKKVIPGMQKGSRTEIVAIASRDLERACRAAQQLHIARAYGSYEALLADGEMDAIYDPLPNHLHVPCSWKSWRRDDNGSEASSFACSSMRGY